MGYILARCTNRQRKRITSGQGGVVTAGEIPGYGEPRCRAVDLARLHVNALGKHAFTGNCTHFDSEQLHTNPIETYLM